jgi:transposase/FtsZ-binding cell division protein ZapB
MSTDARLVDDTLETLLARVRELDAQCTELRAERDAAQSHAQSLKDEAQTLRSQTHSLQEQARRLAYDRERLSLQVKRLAYLLYGRRSEKLSTEELRQLALDLGASEAEAAAPDPSVPHAPAPSEAVDSENDAPSTKKATKKRRAHPGRTRLAPELERVVTQVRVPDSQRQCSCCGREMTAFRVVEHERIEHVSEKLIVQVEQREVLGCTGCRGDAKTAKRAAPARERRAGDSLLAHLIESKCDDALPIHRQRDQLSRLGFDVPQSTLYDYFAHGTDLLRPVAGVTLSKLLGQAYVQVDDTTLKVLDRRHPKGRSTGHLWCFTGPGALIGYTFTESWEAAEIAPYLAAIEGFIQCDDYKGYGAQIQGPNGKRILVPPERRLGCFMHVRRRFHAAFKLGDKRAAEPLTFIREIYAIEREAKEHALDDAARRALRQERALPWLDQLDAWVDVHAKTEAPKSPLGRALGYAVHQRAFVRRCFSDGRFEIDNGRVERAIREPAIGRRNFLFTGSADGAKRLAAAYTLVQSCRALGICTRDYLIDVLGKLDANWPLRRIGELIPDRWAKDRGLLPPKHSAQNLHRESHRSES